MPEGDSVRHAAQRIHDALAGHTLTRAEIRVPRFAAVDLRGRTVLVARSRGKHLLVDIGPGTDGGEGLVLHLHLKMEGRIHIHPRGERWRFPGHTARLILADDGTEVVGTELGFLRVLSPAEADDAVSHLGPDLLGPDWDAAEAVRRLRADPERTLGEALLDQRNLAGIGTVYRAELCFLRGVDPRTTVAETPDLPAVVDLSRRLIVPNVGRRRITTGQARRGRELWVYGRDGRPCRRCGLPVERFQLGGPETDSLERICYVCPGCQPRPLAHSSSEIPDPSGEPL